MAKATTPVRTWEVKSSHVAVMNNVTWTSKAVIAIGPR
jgi:hypothetical protein